MEAMLIVHKGSMSSRTVNSCISSGNCPMGTLRASEGGVNRRSHVLIRSPLLVMTEVRHEW